MREIKFMGWDGERMYGPFSVGSEMSMMRFEVLRQYTGLHDKSSKEIYEGDIVDSGRGVKRRIAWNGFEFGAQLGDEWDDRCRMLRHYFIHTDEKIEVIGNIYESPELLEAR